MPGKCGLRSSSVALTATARGRATAAVLPRATSTRLPSNARFLHSRSSPAPRARAHAIPATHRQSFPLGIDHDSFTDQSPQCSGRAVDQWLNWRRWRLAGRQLICCSTILGFGSALCSSTRVCMVSSWRAARPLSHIRLGTGRHRHQPESPHPAAERPLDRWLPVALPLPEDPPFELDRSA